jgi:integrase
VAEDEGLHLGNPASRVRRRQRHASAQPWLNRNELTDLLAAAEDEGGHPYALACLLGLNGLRVAGACSARIEDLAGSRYQSVLQVVRPGRKHEKLRRRLVDAGISWTCDRHADVIIATVAVDSPWSDTEVAFWGSLGFEKDRVEMKRYFPPEGKS